MRPVAFLIVLILGAAPAGAFETNGRHWDEMPVEYWINPTECPVLADGSTIIEIVAAATKAWEDVPCADIEFAFMGTTDKVWDNDDQNTIYCVEDPEEWKFGVGAAGATLWLPKPEGFTVEVDLALNAADLEWRAGGGDALEQGIMDPQAMITHELGHWLGLAHTTDPFGTMYYGLLPNGIQSTPSGDDKAGVCSLYPNDVADCAADGDCPEDHVCADIQGIQVCDEVHDAAGAACDKDHIDCAGMCWVSLYECQHICYFTDQLQGTDGYCAPVCDPDMGLDCPEGYDCTEVVQLSGHICIKGFTPVWPTADDSPEAVEMVDEVVDAPGADLVAEELPGVDDFEGPAADTAGVVEPAPETPADSGGGSGGCAAATAPTPPLFLFLVLLLVCLRRMTCGRPFRAECLRG
jgi:hypothetical protein